MKGVTMRDCPKDGRVSDVWVSVSIGSEFRILMV